MPTDFRRALANHERSLHAISAAIEVAAPRTSTLENCTAEVMRDLARLEGEIDSATLDDLVVALVSLQASKLDATPRQIFEQHFQDAPSDAWWRARVRPTIGGDDER